MNSLANLTLVDQGDNSQGVTLYHSFSKSCNVLQPLRQWLNKIQVHNPNLAHGLCKVIPARCPFEREVKFFSYKLFYIPPLCKLNPFYEEIVALRFRALCYLADNCGEDVTAYC